jgi:multidrug efflux pump
VIEPGSTGSWIARLVKRPFAVLLVFAGVFVFGFAALAALPIASLPDVGYPTINIIANFPGASAETIAATVTAPLERSVAQIEGIKSLTSASRPGSVNVTLQFESGRDIDAAALDVTKALNNAASDLPPDLPHPPTYYKTSSTAYSIFVLALTSDAVPLSKLSELGEDVVARRLQAVPGVGRAFLAGGQRPATRILVNPIALAARDLTMEDLRAAISHGTLERPKGALTGSRQGIPLSANDQVRDALGMSQLVIGWRDGVPIRLSDVAVVENGVESEDRAGWYNGHPAVVLGVLRRTHANVVRTVDLIKRSLDDVVADLPLAVSLNVVTDRTTNTRAAIDHLTATLGVTILAVIGSIYIFVRRAAATFIPALAIPASLLATFIGMLLLGTTIDNLSLMALAISVGFVVDDAIVVTENVIHQIEAGKTPPQAVIAGTQQVGFTILSITVSLVAVFIPVMFIPGVIGTFFREFGIVVSVCVLVSGVVSLTLTPVLCLLFLKRDLPIAKTDEAGWLASIYSKGLDWVLRHRTLTLVGFFGVIAGTGFLYHAVPKGFLPRQDIGTLDGFVDAPSGVAPALMKSRISALMDIVRKDPAVVTVTAYLAGDSGTMYINLKDRSDRDSADMVIARLRTATGAVHGARLYLQPTPELVLNTDDIPTEYQYTLSSGDSQVLRTWAPRFEQAIRGMPFMRDVQSDLRPGVAQLSIQIDRQMAARLGIDAAAIDDALFQAFGQQRAARIFDDASQRYIFVQFDRRFQQDSSALSFVNVRGSHGALVPLTAISHFEPAQAQSVIRHIGRLPAASINFNLAPGTSLGAAVAAIREVEHQLSPPSVLHGYFEGTAGEFEHSLANEPLLIGAALLVVYLVLAILYESAWHPLTILSSLPSAGAGALLAIYLLGGEFTLISLVGVLLLIGIVKKNAIMIVDFSLKGEREEGLSPVDAVRQACTRRFRPIMMTTLAALMGTLPLALDRGAGAELRNPLGIAIVGGLLLSQLLTLYSTPVIYLALSELKAVFGRFSRASVGTP